MSVPKRPRLLDKEAELDALQSRARAEDAALRAELEAALATRYTVAALVRMNEAGRLQRALKLFAKPADLSQAHLVYCMLNVQEWADPVSWLNHAYEVFDTPRGVIMRGAGPEVIREDMDAPWNELAPHVLTRLAEAWMTQRVGDNWQELLRWTFPFAVRAANYFPALLANIIAQPGICDAALDSAFWNDDMRCILPLVAHTKAPTELRGDVVRTLVLTFGRRTEVTQRVDADVATLGNMLCLLLRQWPEYYGDAQDTRKYMFRTINSYPSEWHLHTAEQLLANYPHLRVLAQEYPEVRRLTDVNARVKRALREFYACMRRLGHPVWDVPLARSYVGKCLLTRT